MDYQTLQTYCQKRSESWSFSANGPLAQPFTVGDYTYASNGFYAVRVPKLEEAALATDAQVTSSKTLDGLFSGPFGDPYVLAQFDFVDESESCPECDGEGSLYTCFECDGDGRVDFSNGYNDYEFECESCDGKGYLTKRDWEETFNRLADECGYARVICEECDGSGGKISNPDVFVGAARFQGQFIKKFITLEKATIAPGGNLSPAYLSWVGGEAILMPKKSL